MKVLTIGAVTTDLLMRVERLARPDEEVRVISVDSYDGGSAANVAVALSRLGLEAAYFGCVGDDSEGTRHLTVLSAEGVDTRRVMISRTGSRTSQVMGFVECGGARQLYFHGAASEEITADDITEELLDGIEWVHVCTLGPEFAERILELNRRRPRHIGLSLDPGCVGLEGDRAERVRASLGEVDALFVNEVEFERLFPGMRPEEAGRLPPEGLAGHTAIKLGERGAYLLTRRGDLTYHPAFRVTAVDSTGAGDAFAAGFLVGIARHYSPEYLGPFANAVAALVAKHYGARVGLPSLDRVESFLREQRSPPPRPPKGRNPAC